MSTPGFFNWWLTPSQLSLSKRPKKSTPATLRACYTHSVLDGIKGWSWMADHPRAARETLLQLCRRLSEGRFFTQLPIIIFPTIRSQLFKLLAFLWVVSLSHSPVLAYNGHRTKTLVTRTVEEILPECQWYIALSSPHTPLIASVAGGR